MLTLLSADLTGNPYPLYEAIRTRAPVYFDPELKQWLVTGYREASLASSDVRLSSSIDILMRPSRWRAAGTRSRIDEFLDNMLLLNDPPRHTRLRSALKDVMTAEVLRRVRVRTQSVVHQLLDSVAERGTMDMVGDLAYPLPLHVIGSLLGVDGEMLNSVKRQGVEVLRFLGSDDSSPEGIAGAEQAVAERDGYFLELIAKRRKEPMDDLISALIGEQRSDRLDAAEICGICGLLFTAGHETTSNLIANSMLVLLQHPEQMSQLRREPELMGTAIEECLRYESPVQWTGRIAMTDIELGGMMISKGEVVMIGRGAANRDPSQFPVPNSFDIGRKPNRHLAFGFGPHSCLGAALARVQGEIAIGAILERRPGLRLDECELQWEQDLAVRTLKSLPASF